ncbi:hypothetical protein MMC28_003315 [Mycoblastus sanguinarius]|nr:hypothetical protein [Mycoblastus sanguinarius]
MSTKRKRSANELTSDDEPERKILIAVDFGTTFSGMAWAQSRRPDHQTMILQWPSAKSEGLEGKSYEKIPTEIQYDGEDYKWGYQIVDSTQRHQWFKLDLDPSHNRATELSANNPDPKAAPPGYNSLEEKYTTDFLTGMRKHAEHILRRTLPQSALNSTPIEYVLTVPAVWSDSAQAKTRQCAEKAGMGAGSKVHMISEPEAAAMYALHEMDTLNLEIGDSFVLCDAGGGTVDLITYTVSALKPLLKVTEASPGTGALCGGSFLNRRFQAYIEQKLGNEPGWDDEVLEDAMNDFEEEVKRNFSGTFAEKHKIAVPGLGDNGKLGIRRNKVTLNGTEIRLIFEPVLDEVLKLVMAQIKAAKVIIKAVLLVGGFGQNAYLRDCISKEVGPKIEVKQSQDAWTAVVRGALIKGLASSSPSWATVSISARSARKHYGILARSKFVSHKHDIHRREWNCFSGCYKICTMDWFVKKGSIVEEGNPVRLSYYETQPMSSGRFHSISTQIYVCNDRYNTGAPLYKTADVTELVRFHADLTRIPSNKILLVEGADLQKYYQISYEIQITHYSAHTTYELIHNNVNYGAVNAVLV